MNGTMAHIQKSPQQEYEAWKAMRDSYNHSIAGKWQDMYREGVLLVHCSTSLMGSHSIDYRIEFERFLYCGKAWNEDRQRQVIYDFCLALYGVEVNLFRAQNGTDNVIAKGFRSITTAKERLQYGIQK